MSTGLGLVTIQGCLSEGEKIAGLSAKNWSSDESSLRYFAEKFVPDRSALDLIDKESLRSFATCLHPEIIAKMKEWGMRLDQIPDGGSSAIYMISQLREMMKWMETGKRVDNRCQWPEFILKNVEFLGTGQDLFTGVVVKVPVEGGDTVYLYRCPQSVDDELDLLQFVVEGIESEMFDIVPPLDYKGVQIPYIYADLESKLEWILGMKNGDYFISYAQQKILFGMNQIGFAVREETAMAITMGIHVEPPPYILSPNGESFLFWRRRPGVFSPISIFQFTKDDFKDPGDLNKIIE